ncbi:MAG: AI-2E family transporter [Deltaproteobacteria bacterium]|nr:AI-2E family transporter [Deltaproteobacteria bacterium]MBW2052595.1 AI-2E family transporter [Deltaproteobacteria bacterium]MBW2141235.1 AI-2E family transporter [Deltaproteobacteria bacterium]
MINGLNSIGRTISSGRGYIPFMLLMLIFSLFLAVLILRPFAQPIILAIVLASLFHPVHVRFVRLYRGRQIPAALTVVFLITFLIIIPMLLFLSALFAQGVESFNQIYTWLNEGNFQKTIENPKIAVYMEWVRQNFTFIDFGKLDLQDNLMGLSKSLAQVLLSRGANLVGNITGIITSFFIMVFIAFYFIKDGEKLVERIKYLSPLSENQEEQIFGKVKNVARSVLVGSFLTACCQGIAGGIGLAIVGIPALFWGAVMAIASLIPIVGTALVWVPAVVYLIIMGKWISAIFLTIYSMVLVGSIDNFLRPYFMKGQAEMSPFIIFLAIIGGIQLFGLMGILYGPLIISFATVMLYIYSIEFKSFLDSASTNNSPEDQPE